MQRVGLTCQTVALHYGHGESRPIAQSTVSSGIKQVPE